MLYTGILNIRIEIGGRLVCRVVFKKHNIIVVSQSISTEGGFEHRSKKYAGHANRLVLLLFKPAKYELDSRHTNLWPLLILGSSFLVGIYCYNGNQNTSSVFPIQLNHFLVTAGRKGRNSDSGPSVIGSCFYLFENPQKEHPDFSVKITPTEQ